MEKIVLHRRRLRSSRGQGILLGILVVFILASIIGGGLLLLASVGMSTYYQEKFNAVATATARFAVNCNYWLGAARPVLDTAATDSASIAVANAMLGQMGVSSGQATVTVDQSQSSGCFVTITVTNLPIAQGITFGAMTITAKGFVSWMDQAPAGVEGLSFTQGQGGYYMASYGAGAHSPGPSTAPDVYSLVPYWENGAFNGLVPPLAGPLQNTQNGGPCTTCY